MLTNLPAYSMRVFWSEHDEGYIAVCPELGGVSAFGHTPEDAVRELKTVTALVIEDMQAEGEPLPEAYLEPNYSGQFRVRIPRSLHERLVVEAGREGVSLNAWVLAHLAEACGLSKVYAEMRKRIDELHSLVTGLRIVRPVSDRRPTGENASFPAGPESRYAVASSTEGDDAWLN